MIDVIGGLQVFVDLKKIMKIVANAQDSIDSLLFCLLGYYELFDRILMDQPDVGMSIKKFHGVSKKEGYSKEI
jgi:hypothetical protein